MHSYMLLHLLLFAQAATSSLLSNLWTSSTNANMKRYIVSADSSDTTKQLQTRGLLESKYGDELQTSKDGGESGTWVIVSVRDDLQDDISMTEGVDRVIVEEEDLSPATSKRDEPVGEVHSYMVGRNTSIPVEKTEEFLNSTVQAGSSYRRLIKKGQTEVRGWGGLMLDEEAVKKVEEHEGVIETLVNDECGSWRALPHDEQVTRPQRISRTSAADKDLFSRADKWGKQEHADWSLRMDSQYPDPESDLNNMNDFVYAPELGEGSFVYVIDEGINIHVLNPNGDSEFKSYKDPETGKDQVLQTDKSKATNKNEGDEYRDDAPEGIYVSHGTSVASKAVGKQFGIAKEATLISVKIVPSVGEEFNDAMELIIEDLTTTHPERQGRSVVVTSKFFGKATYKQTQELQVLREWFGEPITELFKLGAPLIYAAGNMARDQNRQQIDTLPGVAQDANIPIINVGSATFKGERFVSSQFGTQLTIYAPGENVDCQLRDDKDSKARTGTSFAAPQVAGLLATYMSYDPKPWDDSKTEIERVKAIVSYLTSKDSSWERKPGQTDPVNIMWNGATEEKHKEACANGLCNTNSEPVPDPEPAPAPAPASTKALSIIFQNLITEADNENMWLYFAVDFGVSALCKDDSDAALVSPTGGGFGDVDTPPWPPGADMDLHGVGCRYTGGDNDAGSLNCDGGKIQVSCKKEEAKDVEGSETCDFGVYQHKVVYCEW